MAATLQGVKIGSIVHRFITSGKPGSCELCHSIVEKLEAHHIKYEPEITINLCHDCHHRVHFWPRRVTKQEKFKILKKVFDEPKALELSEFKFADVSELAKIIAPSRSKFIHDAQRLDEIANPVTKEKKIISEVRLIQRKHQNKNPIRQLAGRQIYKEHILKLKSQQSLLTPAPSQSHNTNLIKEERPGAGEKK